MLLLPQLLDELSTVSAHALHLNIEARRILSAPNMLIKLAETKPAVKYVTLSRPTRTLAPQRRETRLERNLGRVDQLADSSRLSSRRRPSH